MKRLIFLMMLLSIFTINYAQPGGHGGQGGQFGGLFQWRYPADYLRRYLYRQDLHTDFQRLQCRQGYVCPGTLISMFYVGFMVRLIAPHLGWLDAILLVGHEVTPVEAEEKEEEEEERKRAAVRGSSPSRANTAVAAIPLARFSPTSLVCRFTTVSSSTRQPTTLASTRTWWPRATRTSATHSFGRQSSPTTAFPSR